MRLFAKNAVAGLALMAASLNIGGAANAAAATSFEPKTLMAALTDAGYKAKLTRDDETREPFIESASGGNTLKLAFSGCTKGEGCDQVEFIALWTCEGEVKTCTEAASRWNEEENFAHIVMAGDAGDAVALYHHLLFDKAGISPELFVANFELFSNDAERFLELVDKVRGK